jgi:hypothetical protein
MSWRSSFPIAWNSIAGYVALAADDLLNGGGVSSVSCCRCYMHEKSGTVAVQLGSKRTKSSGTLLTLLSLTPRCCRIESRDAVMAAFGDVISSITFHETGTNLGLMVDFADVRRSIQFHKNGTNLGSRQIDTFQAP